MKSQQSAVIYIASNKMGFLSLPSSKAFVYPATSVGAGMINSIFTFYYVKIYIDRFHVSKNSFQLAQVVFMVWNAINDPLFGYVQDNYSFSWVKSRRHSILYGAPLFSISFLLTWIPWGDYSETTWLAGFQLMFCLCFYDALFTFVLLAHCSLFAEMFTTHDERLHLIRTAQVASLVGSSSVFIINLLSTNSENFFVFQVVCGFFALFSYLCFSYTGKYAETTFDVAAQKRNELGETENMSEIHENNYSAWKKTWQIFKEPAFIAFVLVNFCQMFQATFLSNFLAIICDSLISSDVLTSTARGVFYGCTFLLPQLLLIFATPIVGKIGYYTVIKFSFSLKIFLGLSLYAIGPSPVILIIFFLLEGTETPAVFGLFNMCLSDIIDADMAKYQRKRPQSSMVFGMNALVTKPAISLAPMLVVGILDQYGYSTLKDNLKYNSSGDITDQKENLLHVMFLLTCTLPVVMGLIQSIVWRKFPIKNSHISTAKYLDT